jgi:hypothetical protein
VLARFFGPSEYFQPWITSPFIIYIGTAVATAILIICLCLWVKKYNDVFLIVSLIITVTLIISPVSWLHYFTLASIPFLFIIFQIKSRLKEIPLYIILLAALAIGLIFLMPPDDFPGFSLVTSTYGLASSAITLFLLIYLAKDKCFTVFQPPTKAGAGTTRTNTLWWSKWRL